MNESLKAVLLGLVEGLTEFIPVSSTGHLILAGKALDFNSPAAHTFEVFIQLGAVLAVIFVYREIFIRNLSESGLSSFYPKLFIAAFPALLAGALFYKHIKALLFTPVPVAFALILGGIILYFAERISFQEKHEEVTWKDSFYIGLAQIFSLWPGMSRSGSTIIGGLFCGLPKRQAADFSFMLAVPVISAATLYDLYKSFHLLDSSNIWIFSLGFCSAFIFSLLAIKFFLSILNKFSLKPFAIYRIILGFVVIFLAY